MKKLIPIFTVFVLGISTWACERPKSPDVQFKHSLETPLSLEEEYELLGTNEALIDTLSSNYLDGLELDPFTDTLKINFSSLPNNQGDQIINEASIDFQYANEIPLDIELSFLFLGEKRSLLFEKPRNNEDRYIIKGSSENINSEILEKNNINIPFLNEQLDDLHKTRHLVLRFDLKLNDDIELSDFSENVIRFELDLDTEIISTVN